jgi:hypothetical protein
LGRGDDPNLFLRLDFDGTIHTNGGAFGRAFEEFGVISGSAHATHRMEEFLRKKSDPRAKLDAALETAIRAWAVGHWIQREGDDADIPSEAVVKGHITDQLSSLAVEAAILDRTQRLPATWRALPEGEVRANLDRRLG